MKIIFRSLILLLFIIIFFLSYLSIVGFETKRFNDQIIKKVKNINENLEIELKEIKIILDPFRLKLNAKTVGSKLKNKNKVLEIEKINTQIPLKSLLNENSIIESLEISTKSIKIKDLISFIRVINNNAELYLLEKVVKKGFLIADVKLYFDKDGNIKNNYEISGFVKDTKIKILKNYRLNKLNLNFSYKKNVLDFKNISVSLNNLNFVSKNLNFKNIKDEFIIKGEIGNKSIVLDNKNIELFIKPHFPDLDIDKIIFSSKNKFSFKVNKKFQFNDLDLKSEIEINEFLLLNDFQLKKIFPKIKKNIKFSNHKLKMNLEKKILMVNGMGNILLQNNNDKLTYSINKKGKILNFKTSLRVKDNPLIIDFLNYKKEENNEILINLNGSKELKNKTKIDLISLKENNNKFIIEGLELDKEFKITDLKTANISYRDRENVKNKFNIINKKDNFYVAGSIFNANKLVESLINDDEDELDIINKNFKLIIKIDKLC